MKETDEDMAKSSGTAVEAREVARQRRIGLDVDRIEREDRIDTATALVIVAQGQIEAAAATAQAAKDTAAGIYEAAAAHADTVAAAASTAAQLVIGEAVRAILADKVPVSQVATLTELSQSDVRRYNTHSTTPVDATAPAVDAPALVTDEVAAGTAEPVTAADSPEISSEPYDVAQ